MSAQLELPLEDYEEEGSEQEVKTPKTRRFAFGRHFEKGAITILDRATGEKSEYRLPTLDNPLLSFLFFTDGIIHRAGKLAEGQGEPSLEAYTQSISDWLRKDNSEIKAYFEDFRVGKVTKPKGPLGWRCAFKGKELIALARTLHSKGVIPSAEVTDALYEYLFQYSKEEQEKIKETKGFYSEMVKLYAD